MSLQEEGKLGVGEVCLLGRGRERKRPRTELWVGAHLRRRRRENQEGTNRRWEEVWCGLRS